MELTKKQLKLVKKINDKEMTVEHIERFYNERPGSIRGMNQSLIVLNCAKVNSFMKAVNGLLKNKV